ncbi:MAG: glycosyltransferase family 4 protein [Hydrogenophaga sp.]|nr:glycosyltransferase family 4 protein [Hydrogenophaga sp.]
MRICFFANMGRHANWREMFDKVEFYRVDIRLLRELGHEVVLAGHPASLDRRADLYYCWWWGHAPFALALGALRRKPVLVTGAFDYATCREEIPGMCYLDRPRWQQEVLKASLRHASANLFISAYEHDEVTSHLRVNNPVLAPLAVDTGFYRPALSASDAATAEEPYFFSVSWTSTTNVIRKGVRQTIEAFASIAHELPGARLKLAGKPGDHHPKLQELVGNLGLQNRVDFLGMISDEEKRDHYQRCLAYVQPTLYEGFGLAIAEAIACGSRVVTSDRGAVPEVAGDFGTCIPPKDVQAIAAAMLQTASIPYSTQERECAHEWIVNNYSVDQRLKRLQKILDALT